MDAIQPAAGTTARAARPGGRGDAPRSLWARRLGLVLLLAAALIVLAAVAASAATFAQPEQDFVEKINEERTAVGLAPLSVDIQLVRVARTWSATMSERAVMFHNPNLGGQVLGDWTRLGENVGHDTYPEATPEQHVERLHTAFMASPGHKANVLGDFSTVGVGVVLTTDGQMWVTVNFMKATVVAAPQVDEAIGVSEAVFGAAGAEGRQATHVVLGRAEVFADSLGGTGLAGADAPILFTPGPSANDADPILHPAVRAEIDRVLGGQGTVYVLGGTSAVSGRAAGELSADGYAVQRLAGASRVETSVVVAEEVVRRNGNVDEVLIARSDDWADAVTGGAYAAAAGIPVVLTGRDGLHPAVSAFLRSSGIRTRWALGGRSALGDEVVAAAEATRISGPDRASTAVEIARQLWGRTAASSGDSYVTSPGWASDGWAYALAYAPFAAAHDSPALLVNTDVPQPVRDYLGGLGYSASVRGDVAAASVVPRPVVDSVRALVGG